LAYSESYLLHLQQIGKYPLLEREEELALAVRIQAGDAEALERMILSNLRIAACVANQYAGLGMSQEDLLQESTRGLMIAAQRYRPGFGTKFSSYAGWWCRQSVRHALSQQSRHIRLPQHVVDRLSVLRRAEKDGELTVEELSESTGLPVNEINELREMSSPVMSLDVESFDDGTSFGEAIPDDNSVSPADRLSDSNMAQEALSANGLFN
jgi:RNA polymerase sigma factor (sigma-70 family)